MKFNSQCKTAQDFKRHAGSLEAVEFFKNIHIPNCPKCRKRAPAASAKVSSTGDGFIVASFTDPAKSYKVTKKGKRFRCSCPRWIYGNHKIDCKHIERVKKAA